MKEFLLSSNDRLVGFSSWYILKQWIVFFSRSDWLLNFWISSVIKFATLDNTFLAF